MLGIGVNVAVQAFPEELRETAGSLGFEKNAREPFLTSLLAALESRLAEPAGATIEALNERDALRGRAIRWAGGEGIAEGIDDAGPPHRRGPTPRLRRGPPRVLTMELPKGRITIPDGVVRRQFGDDKVLLNLATGHYHGLNPTGGYMIALLQETGDAEETARRTARELDTPIERVRDDLAALCAALVERGLITVED